VAKVRDELERLALRPVGAVTAEVGALPDTPILIGTEAVLHRVATGPTGGDKVGVAAVVFLDFDSELLAPRFRAAEDALALLARASRILGGRDGGRIVVQTRLPDHPVLDAARRADPTLVSTAEDAVRRELNLPPVSALAEISGDPARIEALVARLAGRPAVEVIGPTDGVWLVRAPDHTTLCDALAHAGRPVGEPGTRLRVDVDPLRA
jgi:primosomal protein N' (replication factor Y)